MSVWNDKRERERERWYLLQLRAKSQTRAKLLWLQNQKKHSIPLGNILSKNKIRDFFLISWTSYKFEWLGILFLFSFFFLVFFLLNNFFSCYSWVLFCFCLGFYCCYLSPFLGLKIKDYIWGQNYFWSDDIYSQHFHNKFYATSFFFFFLRQSDKLLLVIKKWC